jgi:ribonuclease P protein subunit POP4
MVKADTIISHEIIGRDIQILDKASEMSKILHGRIIGETKNTILVRTASGTKIIPKENSNIIKFNLDTGVCFINSSSLVGRPEDRISRNR